MTACTSCGTDNADGAKFCVRCGAPMAAAPAPGSWRASSELNNPPFEEPSNQAGGYSTPNPPPGTYTPPPAVYPQYGQPQGQMGYQTGAAEPMHPAVPAIVSFFLPGIGLLFVPNKVGLGIGIFAAYLALNVVLFILAIITLGLGTCLFFLVPLVNILAGIHSWDEAAKNSQGKFQPILFKN